MAVEVVNSSAKMHLARKGPAKVFGDDVDRREAMSDADALAWFDGVWRSRFANEMARAPRCELQSVIAKVPKGAHPFIARDAEHREVVVANCLFIAQLPNPESCDQLWFISSTSGDPRTLYIRFETVDERKYFEEVARSIGWRDHELGLQLIRDFMKKIDGTTSEVTA